MHKIAPRAPSPHWGSQIVANQKRILKVRTKITHFPAVASNEIELDVRSYLRLSALISGKLIVT